MASANARYAVLASASFGVLVTTPLFYSLLEVSGREVPAHAQLLRGGRGSSVWKGMNAEGDTVYLRFNSFGMVSYTSPDVSHKGPVSFAERSLTIEPVPLPVIASLSTPLTLQVSRWPSEQSPDLAEVEGVAMYKME
jgi:hypothetical protein